MRERRELAYLQVIVMTEPSLARPGSKESSRRAATSRGKGIGVTKNATALWAAGGILLNRRMYFVAQRPRLPIRAHTTTHHTSLTRSGASPSPAHCTCKKQAVADDHRVIHPPTHKEEVSESGDDNTGTHTY